MDRIDALRACVRDLDAVFSCEGTLTLPAPVELRFRNGRVVRVERDRTRSRDVGKRIMQQCEPARFGLGTQTRTDRRVRDGWQLLADGGALTMRGLDLAKTGILEQIRRELCPDDASLPVAELHALNVYRSGGHFVRHKDTPRDDTCFGTLVVCLPVPFSGGRLVLRNQVTRSYAWASRDSYHRRDDEDRTLRWAAFYGDVDHEIEPVTDGTRVTLTWLLRRSPRFVPSRRRPAATEQDLERALVDALGDARFMSRGGLLGVPCVHLYNETHGVAHQGKPLSSRSAARLKGRDRLVALAALRAGLGVRFSPYLYEDCAEQSWRLSRVPTSAEAAIFSASHVTAYDLEAELPIERAFGWENDDDVTWLSAPPWQSPRRASPAEAEPATSTLGSVEYSATGYFGNEGGHSTFYAAGALLVTVPPARERSKSTRRGSSIERASSQSDGGEPRFVPTPMGSATIDALERIFGSMTVDELCRRTGVTIAALVDFCVLGSRAAPTQSAALSNASPVSKPGTSARRRR